MNERIKELAEQAGFYVAGSKIYIPSTSEDITTCQTKFAELIVRECMAVARSENEGDKRADSWDRGWILGVESVRESIAEHFGVQE